jgi:hypothetical protein
VFKFSKDAECWEKLDSQPSKRFLYFSSISHLPNGKGCFILGGSDYDDNYYTTTLEFQNYSKFIERKSMINPRAFFSSVYCNLNNSIYVFGGNNGQNDIKESERYCLKSG